MENLRIYKNKHPVLRKKCQAVSEVTIAEQRLFENMTSIMRRDRGLGLAAVQLGILKQMIVIDIGAGALELVNPRIVERKGRKKILKEGCLSLPGVFVCVSRRRCVSVRALDKSGKEVLIEAQDLLARVLQHEIDHLRGILIIDYLPWYKRLIIDKKLPDDQIGISEPSC